MRAALIEAFGEPTEVLELVDVPEPTGPAAGEVLVGVEYAPINMNDLYVIQGAFPVRPSLDEGVGRVLAVGSGVERLKVGDQVLIPLYAFSWRERLGGRRTFRLTRARPLVGRLETKYARNGSTEHQNDRATLQTRLALQADHLCEGLGSPHKAAAYKH
jgi:NADPH:quinone reductase-like Zn-dependent oxidoreductase